MELTNAVNVLVYSSVGGTWEVEVDNVHDVSNIETTGCDIGCNHDRRLAGTESTPSTR